MEKINLKNIIRWEQLTKRPFSAIDFSKEEDITTFIYVSSKNSVPLSVFKNTVNSKAFLAELKSLTKDLEIMQQFINNEKQNEKQKEEIYLTDVAFGLIAKGVSPDYVMSLTLPDLPHLLKAVEKEQQERMEESRLWTFFSILPHVSKGMNNPTNLIEFPWETIELAEQRQKDLEESINLTKTFLENGK